MPDRGGKDASLLTRLAAYSEEAVYPMHMPGHKRNRQALDPRLPWALDITEIDGFDDLHAADGFLKDGMARAAALYGSERAFYLVNGSSGGLLAGIRACTRHGDTVLIARNSHRAVYHALELNGLRPVYLQPVMDVESGLPGSITPGQVEMAASAHPGATLCVLPSPTYDGVVSDVRGIADVLHAKGIPLFVDEAHGAHLGLSDRFPASAVSRGADLVVQSLHKTLSGLTQTALLHVQGRRIDADELARQLMIFETSSPSYVLMASIDECVRTMEAEKDQLMAAYAARLSAFDEAIAGLRRLRVVCHGGDAIEAHPAFWGFDPGKLALLTRGAALTGRGLYDRLLGEYGIQLEMAAVDSALAMTSPYDTDEGFERLARALGTIDKESAPRGGRTAAFAMPALPEQILPIDEAVLRARRAVTPEQAIGQISAAYLWAYPPGIPLLTPGERIDADMIHAIEQMKRAGIAPRGLAKGTIDQLLVL